MGSITRYLAQHALALVALVVALGGSAYAATQVGSADIANNSIRSKDIRDNGVKPDDLASLESTFSVQKESGSIPIEPNVHVQLRAVCKDGTAVGGGAATDVPDVLITSDGPLGPGAVPAQTGDQAVAWGATLVDATNFSGPVTATIWAICTDDD